MLRCVFLLLLALIVTGATRAQPAEDLHAQAVKESLIPIRPGRPGRAPFWNEQARQCIVVPAFEFRSIDGARSFRFTLVAAGDRSFSFEANEPWAPLTPVWADVPVGTVKLTVEALNQKGDTIGAAQTRTFHRAAVFNGPYGKPVLAYDQSARVALKSVIDEPFVRSWRTTGEPDPQYPLYRYSSKIIGKLLTACAMYTRQTPRPGDADEALEIGRRAADFLIGITATTGPLAGMPPTYHGAAPTERENDNWTMMMTPAEAAQGYLDLYEATRDQKYLDAATRIAEGYARLQLPSGTWRLKVDNRTNDPLAQVDLIPAEVIDFLERFSVQIKSQQASATLDRAVRWMMDNPMRTFNWQAQFDDGKMLAAYQNMAKHEACMFAGYLFRHAEKDRVRIAAAEELLRFAEDQFVVWETPPESSSRFEKAENWFTPGSAEQYTMFEPISGSSAFMIMTYVRAHQATGKALYLAKADSLANTLTLAQEHYHGRYPTRLYRSRDRTCWINSTVNTIRGMNMLAAEHERREKGSELFYEPNN